MISAKIPQFKNPQLLKTALTHRSALNELTGSDISYERLEFLGDAVLELLTTRFLFDTHPHEPEGILTAYRSALVKTTTLAKVAQNLGLDDQIYMSKGEEQGGGRSNQGILADIFEAVMGALYLDQGLPVVDAVLQENLYPLLEAIKQNRSYRDPKTALQELVQAHGYATPEYVELDSNGPDHQRTFSVRVKIGNTWGETGQGTSKQRAQRQAAQNTLQVWLPRLEKSE